MPELPSVAVLLSGGGTNLQAIADYAARVGTFRIAGVISDQPDAGGLARAARMDLPATVCARARGASRAEHEHVVVQALAQWSPDLVALAGYMRILSGSLVSQFEGRMLNVHPSLLPRYRGLDTYRRALADGAAQHGSSVHYVTEELDGGPVIAQAATAIADDDDEQSLRHRVQAMEYRLFPRVIDAVCRGDIGLADGHVHWRRQALPAPLSLEQLEEVYR
jgi:phosphoribosylglycinamide formyltransferase-1